MFRQICVCIGLLPAVALAQSVNINGGNISVDTGDTKVKIVNSNKGNSDKKAVTQPKGEQAIVIDGVSQSANYACNNQNVVVRGTSNYLTFTGSCTQITIEGTDNRVQVDKVGIVSIEGTSNTVLWKSGNAPKIVKNDGVSNSVQRYK